MNSLDLYSIIEEYLDFNEEIEELYSVYRDFAIERNVDSIIDIGCGQGAFLLSLSNKIKTLGIDLSDEQIKVCQTKGLNAQVIDIKDVQETFQMATAVFDVLNYINGDDLKNFIESCAKVVEKDGYFLFDVNSLYGFEEVAQGSLSIDLDDKFIGIDAIYEDDKLHTTINYFTQNNSNYIREKNTITQYYHSKEKIKKVLTKSGFGIETIINFHLHDEDKNDKYIFIARKK